MPSLLLHPDDPDWVPAARTDFVTLLRDLELIEVPADTGQASVFWLGRRFLALVMFLGCSPHVLIDPRDGGKGPPVCHLRYHEYPDPRFVSARRPPTVRCPHCRAPASGSVPSAPHAPFSCPQCGRISAAHALDWRQSAGFGRCFLEITGICPHEAVPSDRLLESLRGYSRKPLALLLCRLKQLVVRAAVIAGMSGAYRNSGRGQNRIQAGASPTVVSPGAGCFGMLSHGAGGRRQQLASGNAARCSMKR